MPDVGEGLTEAEVVTWHVAPGDTVTVNQVIVEIETAKAAVELPCPYAGTVGELLVEPGQTVSVGAPIIAIETAEAGAPAASGAPSSPTAVPAQARVAAPAEPAAGVEETGAKIGEAGKDGRIATLVGYGPRPGSVARRPRRVVPPASASVPASPATSPAPVPAGSTPPRPAGTGDHDPGTADRAQSGSASPTTDHERAANGSAGRAVDTASAGGTRGAGPVPLAKPPVRKLAKDLRVDLRLVTATGPGGVITRDDVEAHARATTDPAADPAAAPGSEVAPAAAALAAATDRGAADIGDAGIGDAGIGEAGIEAAGAPPAGPVPVGVRREPIRGVRRATAAAMVSSAFTAPHVTEFLAVDVTAMMALRDRLRTASEYADVKLTPLAFVAKAVCLAARRTPEVNAHWDEAAGEIVYYDRVQLGIAAATPRGLIVPKVRDADTLTLRELAGALGALTATARSGKTPPADLTGGTFTITNVGVFGVDTGTPILNPGEAAILAVGAVKPAPWVVDGELAVRTVCQLALSFDHRLVDGEQGSRFLSDVGALLTDPSLALTW